MPAKSVPGLLEVAGSSLDSFWMRTVLPVGEFAVEQNISPFQISPSVMWQVLAISSF